MSYSKSRVASVASPLRPVAQPFPFGFLVHDVSRIRRTLMDHYLRPLGVTRSQWTVMSALSREGETGIVQSDLARLLGIGKVSLAGLVGRLEATGHVERLADPMDRRIKRVFITEQGYHAQRAHPGQC
jgi:MarR family transcriptional regulator for hemolysin